MALLHRIVCSDCGQNKEVVASANSYPTVCTECLKKRMDARREEWLKMRASATIEERLRLIEEFIYDHELQHRKIPKNYFFG